MNYQQVKSAALEETNHIGELHVPPASLIATFGEPNDGLVNREGVGEYYYQSTDGDYFVVYSLDPEVTPNNIDEMKDQFWIDEEPVPFCVAAKCGSDVYDFKHWLQMQISDKA
jgi:hypothetical protein